MLAPCDDFSQLLHRREKQCYSQVKDARNIHPDGDQPPTILPYIDLSLQRLGINTGSMSGTLPKALVQANITEIRQESSTIQHPQSSVSQNENRQVSQDRSGGAASISEKCHNNATKAGLAAIFNKIGDKEFNKEGLRDLYRFKETHQNVGAPLTSLACFLAQVFSDR
ncbi:hypothetical protein BSKO_02738 [Bryopsis sp. KO-2023]|nr:hypothetical protein BSKO_02738 [Bryopsis sp. KO-2023]